MKHYKIISLSILSFLFIISSCNIKENNTKKIKKDETTVHRTYYEKSGAIKTEITVKNNKKNGPAKKYYPTGELHTLVHYVNSVKEGKTVWYYRNGQAYRVTNYKNNKMDGIRKIYYEDGTLQAEIPYKDGKLQEGTKEYNESGKLIPNDVKINFEEINNLKFDNQFILKMRLSQKSRKVKFFEERTSEEGTRILAPIKTNVSQTGTIIYNIPKGSNIITVLKIYAEYETKLGHPAMISESYNLVVENR